MATITNLATAQSLIQEFQTQNATAAEAALKTPDGQNLNGFFIDRETLDAILSNPGIVGLSVSFAKHSDFVGSPQNVYTLVVAGAVPNTAPGARYKSIGDIYSDVPPCPSFCVNLG